MKRFQKCSKCGGPQISVTGAYDIIAETGAMRGKALGGLRLDLTLRHRDMRGDDWYCLNCNHIIDAN